MELTLLGSPLFRMLFGAATGAVLGYLLHAALIVLLFHPATPISIGPFSLHGYLLRRRAAITAAFSDFIAREAAPIIETATRQQLETIGPRCSGTVTQWVETFLHTHLPTIHPMAGSLIKGKLGIQLRDMLIRELERLIACTVERISTGSGPEQGTTAADHGNEILFAGVIREHMNTYPMKSIVQAVYPVVSHELHLFRTFGAVTGASTGLLLSIILTAA